jgi:S1-C subfamily serine protease
VDLTAQVRTLPGGSTSTLTYVRGGNTYTVEVTLDEYE